MGIQLLPWPCHDEFICVLPLSRALHGTCLNEVLVTNCVVNMTAWIDGAAFRDISKASFASWLIKRLRPTERISSTGGCLINSLIITSNFIICCPNWRWDYALLIIATAADYFLSSTYFSSIMCFNDWDYNITFVFVLSKRFCSSEISSPLSVSSIGAVYESRAEQTSLGHTL